METRDYVIAVIVIMVLLVAFYLLTKPQYYITEKQADKLKVNDEVIIQNIAYTLRSKSSVNQTLVQLNFTDPQGDAVTLTTNKTDMLPVNVSVEWWDISPIPSPPPKRAIPAPAPVTVPVPSPPALPNATTPPVPTAPNVSVPTPPNATTPPLPSPPNVTPPTPPTPNITNVTPTPPNATTPPPPVPPNITPPTPYPATCYDSTWNGDESDLDCGGSCPKCLSIGMYNYCWDNSDCVSGNCDTTNATRPLPSGYTIQTLRQLAGQTWIIQYQGQCK